MVIFSIPNNFPVCVEEFLDQKVIDAACGEFFTIHFINNYYYNIYLFVVITTNKHHRSSSNTKFMDNLIQNAKL